MLVVLAEQRAAKSAAEIGRARRQKTGSRKAARKIASKGEHSRTELRKKFIESALLHVTVDVAKVLR